MMKTLNLVYGIFKYAALSQLKKEDTMVMSVAAGLMQGLKYTGNLKRGVTAAVTVAATIAVANGAYNVFVNMDNIKTVYRKEQFEKAREKYTCYSEKEVV